MFLSTYLCRGSRALLLAMAWAGGLAGGLVAQTASFDAFDPNPDGNIYTVVVQPDGKTLIGGNFLTMQPNRFGGSQVHQRIARLNFDGSVDQSFQMHCDGAVHTIALQADGRILVGGAFSRVWRSGESVPSTPNRNGLARFNADGTLDATFNPNPKLDANRNNETVPIALVRAIAVQADGRILVGGAFTGFGTTDGFVARQRLARLNADGSLDETFTAGVDNVVQAIAVQPDGAILVGGGFRNYFANPTATAVETRFLVRLLANGTVDPAFGARANNRVLALRVTIDNQILVGGEFTQIIVNGTARTRTFFARLAPNGTVDTQFDPAPNAAVESIAVQADGNIVFGGRFTSIQPGGLGAVFRAHVVRVTPSGSLERSFAVNPDGSVFAIAVQADGSVLLGGNFGSASSLSGGAVSRPRLARVQPDGNVETLFAPAAGRVRQVVREADGNLIVVGEFTNFAGVTRSNIARFDANGNLIAGFNPRINGLITAVAIDGSGKIIIGGTFTLINNTIRTGIARLNADGSVDTGFDPRANNRVHAILVQGDGKIIVGGAFNSFQPGGQGDPVGRVFLARLNADGKVDETFQCNADGTVYTLARNTDDSFFVGGEFQNLTPNGSRNFEFRRYAAIVRGNGQIDASFNPRPNAMVEIMVRQSDGRLLMGGQFSAVFPEGATTSIARSGIARFSADGTLDTAFDPRADGPVYAISPLSDNLIVIGGAFANLAPGGDDDNKVARRFLAFLDGAGKVLTDRELQPNDIVWSTAAVGSDRVLVAGQFTALFRPDGTFVSTDQQITMLRADGTRDPAFVVNAGAGATGTVNAIVQQTDGPILVGGEFANIGGSTESNLVRLSYAGIPATGFGARLNGPVNSIFLRTPSAAVSNATGPVAWLTAGGSLRPLSEFTTSGTAVLNGTVEAIVTLGDGSVLLGGTFANTSGTTGGNLIKLRPDGTIDTAFNPSPNGTVSAIAVDDSGRILVGGGFTQIGGQDRRNFARLSPTGQVEALNLRLNRPVRTIVKGTGNSFYVGGEFTTVQFGDATATGPAYLALITATDTLDANFVPVLDGAVFTISMQADARMLIGGDFQNASNARHRSVARLNSSTGAADVNFKLQFDDLVEGFIPDGDGFIAAGYFINAAEDDEGTNAVVRQRIARFTINSAGAATIDRDFAPIVNGPIHALAIDTQGRLVIVGEFSGITDLSGNGFIVRRYVARWAADGSIDDSFNPQPNDNVWGLNLRPDNSAIIGGTFTSILPEASILVGGSFTQVGNIDRRHLALLNSDGSAAEEFAPPPDQPVHAIAGLADGRVVVAGDFENLGTTPRAHLAVLGADGTIDTTFATGTDGSVRALAVQPDGRLVVGGTFANAGGAAHANLARIALNGTVDAGFTASTNGAVSTLAAQPDGRIVVAGAFTTINGSNQSYLARLNADGTLDTGFAPVLNGPVAAVVLQADGGMLIGGTFTSVSGTPRLRFARLTSTGAVDPSVHFDFDPAITSVDAASEVRAITVLPDGRAVIGGSFKNAGGRARFLITRTPASGVVGQSMAVNSARTQLTWVNAGARAEFGTVTFAWSTDGITFTDLGAATRTGAPGTWQLTVPAFPANQLYYIRARGTLPGSRHYSTGRYETVFQFYNDRQAGPVSSLAGGSGGSNGGGSGSSGGSGSGGSGNGGSGGSSGGGNGSGSGGSGSSGGGTVGGTAGSYHLANFSVRARPNDGAELIVGFVVQAAGGEQVVLRAVGPGLANKGVANVMPAPLLELFDGGQHFLGSATAWQGNADLAAAFESVGAFELDPASADAAHASVLLPGQYTAHVSPSDGSNGIALAEVYFDGNGGLANVSARGPAGEGDAVLIVGFVVGGSEPRRFLVRGIGPGLVQYGVGDALTDPNAEVFDGQGNLVAANADWETQAVGTAADITAASTLAGAFALDAGSKDAALVLTLAPGIYTAHVTGTAAGTGLVEIYELPPDDL